METREEIFSKQKQRGIKEVLQHLLSYAVYQFGDRVPGKDLRERVSGEYIDNYGVEIVFLISIHMDFLSVYQSDPSLSMIDWDYLALPTLEMILELLRPWSTYLELDGTSRIGSLDIDQINNLYMLFSKTERSMGLIYKRRIQFDQSENYCQRAVHHARLFGGKEDLKADLLCDALHTFYSLRIDQGHYDEALIFAEEAYNCVAIAYNPVHPKVQDAASTLIECLTFRGDFNKAELFAQMTLESLKDSKNGLDQESEAVATGYYDLGDVIYQQNGDYVKSEKLVRESLRIRSRIYNNDNVNMGLTFGLLADILYAQGKLGKETQELYEGAHANNIKNYGLNGSNTATTNFNMGNFYMKRALESQSTETRNENLLLSMNKFKEVVRVNTKIYGPDYPITSQAASNLSIVSRMLSEVT
jgi:tetratricopeptide (TPR) repeat protein